MTILCIHEFILRLNIISPLNLITRDSIGGIMVNVLASRVVDPVFEPRSGQTKSYEICICCSSAKHAAIRLPLASNQASVSERGDVYPQIVVSVS